MYLTWRVQIVCKSVCNCRYGSAGNGLNKGLQANIRFSPPPPHQKGRHQAAFIGLA
jgi:hypothetical protein